MQKKHSISTNLLRIFHLSNGNTLLLCVRLLLALAAALLATQARGVARYFVVLECVVDWFLLLVFSVTMISQLLQEQYEHTGV